MEKDEIIDAVHAALNQRDSLDRETHKEHHRFVQFLMDARKKRLDRWENVRQTVIGGLILGTVSGIISFLIWVSTLVPKASN